MAEGRQNSPPTNTMPPHRCCRCQWRNRGEEEGRRREGGGKEEGRRREGGGREEGGGRREEEGGRREEGGGKGGGKMEITDHKKMNMPSSLCGKNI